MDDKAKTKNKEGVQGPLQLYLPVISGIAIDNGVTDKPIIQCLQDEITFKIQTQKLFGGRIFVKGKVEEEQCVATGFIQQRTTMPMLTLPLGVCGMKSTRSTDPRGMYYGITIVVSFHPLFLTKVDQAYHVKCFFEEAERGIEAELGISMIPTTEANAVHGVKGCTYSLHGGTIDQVMAGTGSEIQYAQIGDKVVHRWECVDPMYGMLIRNCYVTDGMGQRADVIDAQGCPIDPILISDVRYSSDLMQAFASSHVFKFADKPALYFFCQVQMCMKQVGHCDGVTPPTCRGFTAIPGQTTSNPDSRNTPTVGPANTPPTGYGTPPPVIPPSPSIVVTQPVTQPPLTGSQYGGAPPLRPSNPSAAISQQNMYGQAGLSKRILDHVRFKEPLEQDNTSLDSAFTSTTPPTDVFEHVSSSVEFGVMDPNFNTVSLRSPTRYQPQDNVRDAQRPFRTEEEELAEIFGPSPQAAPVGVLFEAADSVVETMWNDDTILRDDVDVLDSDISYTPSFFPAEKLTSKKTSAPEITKQQSFHDSVDADAEVLKATSIPRKMVIGMKQKPITNATNQEPKPRVLDETSDVEGQISGQLIVYDLDEEAPNFRHSSKLSFLELEDSLEKTTPYYEDLVEKESCSISTTLFYATIGGFSLLTLVLTNLLWCLHRKLRARDVKSYRDINHSERYIPQPKTHNRPRTAPFLPGIGSSARH